MYDDSGLTKHDVANHTDLNTQLGLAVLTNGSLVLSALTSDGTLSVHEHWPGASGWVQHTVPQPGTSNDGYRLDSIGGDHPTLAIRGNAVSSILSLNETGVWSFVAERPAAATNGAWDLIRHGQHLILMLSLIHI